MARSGRPPGTGEGGAWAGAEEARVALVVSRFNPDVTGRLADGAEEALRRRGVPADRLPRLEVPGAWELPLGVVEVRRAGADAAVAVGCVIRGQTPHFDHICRGATRGLMDCQLRDDGFPVGFGLLTCDDRAQAMARAGGEEGNKGAEAAEAALEMLLLRGSGGRR